MDVGLGLTFQNLSERVSDREVFRHELSLAARAEDQGFDSIWTPETGLVTASLKVQRKPLRDRYNAPGGLLDLMGYRFPES